MPPSHHKFFPRFPDALPGPAFKSTVLFSDPCTPLSGFSSHAQSLRVTAHGSRVGS